VSWKEQQEIEQQLAVITGKMKMLHFCQELQFYNVLTYKQIAEAHINAWPFVPDALSGVLLEAARSPLYCDSATPNSAL
jgi:hypothetical protein